MLFVNHPARANEYTWRGDRTIGWRAQSTQGATEKAKGGDWRVASNTGDRPASAGDTSAHSSTKHPVF